MFATVTVQRIDTHGAVDRHCAECGGNMRGIVVMFRVKSGYHAQAMHIECAERVWLRIKVAADSASMKREEETHG